MGQVQTCAWLYQLGRLRRDAAKVEAGLFPTFMLRAAGSMLLIYPLFNAAFGLNRHELPWLISAFLLAIGGIVLVVAQPWSRIVVLAAAVAAASPGPPRTPMRAWRGPTAGRPSTQRLSGPRKAPWLWPAHRHWRGR